MPHPVTKDRKLKRKWEHFRKQRRAMISRASTHAFRMLDKEETGLNRPAKVNHWKSYSRHLRVIAERLP